MQGEQPMSEKHPITSKGIEDALEKTIKEKAEEEARMEERTANVKVEDEKAKILKR